MSTLKVVDFVALPPSEIMFWRIALLHLLLAFKSDAELDEVLARTAGKSHLPSNLRRFLKTSVGPWVVAGAPGAAALTHSAQELVLLRLRRTERVLAGASTSKGR